MSLSLRPYQDKAINEIRARFLAGDRAVLFQLPTGGGKTVVASFMIKNAVERGLRVYFLAHRDFLLEQTSAALTSMGIKHGVISPLYNQALAIPVQVASIQTVARRLEKLPAPDLIIVDECHRIQGNQYRRVISHWGRARVVGLSASPKRLDGKPMGEIFQSIVQGPPMRELIEMGNLSEFDIYRPPSNLDMSGVKKSFGDFNAKETAERVSKSSITGDAVTHYKKMLSGKRAIVFAASIDASIKTVEEFNRAGIPALHIDGETPANERKHAIKLFGTGAVKILSNVNICVEGFDLPACEGVILLRPTASLVIYLQAVGRALRPAPGKERAIILDHVAASVQHGWPDDEFEWTLDDDRQFRGKRDKSNAVRTKQCPACYLVHEPFFESCPGCGHTYPVKSRKIELREGELVKASREEAARAKKAKRSEVGRARSIEDLQKIATERGYKPGWVKHIAKVRGIPG